MAVFSNRKLPVFNYFWPPDEFSRRLALYTMEVIGNIRFSPPLGGVGGLKGTESGNLALPRRGSCWDVQCV